MPTLTELQDQMNTGDDANKADAAKKLANFYFVYNEEYNAWLAAEHGAESALFKLNHDPDGVDPAERMKLQSLQLRAQSRTKELDERMLAFHAGDAGIRPPSDDTIKEVKRLSGEVSETLVEAAAVETMLSDLTSIALQTKNMFYDVG
jgi:hypothetical protein